MGSPRTSEIGDFYAIESQSQSRLSGGAPIHREQLGAFVVNDLGGIVAA